MAALIALLTTLPLMLALIALIWRGLPVWITVRLRRGLRLLRC